MTKRGESAAEKARQSFMAAKEGDPNYNCAESVLLGAAEALDLTSDAIPRIATVFGGGMARLGGTCGAVTGSLMAISLARGRSSKTEAREPAYEPGAELQRRFLGAWGALNCRELTGCDLSTKEGQERFAASHQHEKCCAYVEMAARTAAELVG